MRRFRLDQEVSGILLGVSDRKFMLTDTMSRSLEALEPDEPGHLKFYSCGPTVYNLAHIGNFRTFITADLVVRTAEALGWKVSYVSNITDVGHLTQDDVADASGEDKMAAALRAAGQQFPNIWDLARYYADAFIDDWERLNLREPMVRPRATEHMREQIQAINQLVKSDHAYVTPSGVYFRLSSFPEHGKLSGNVDKEQLQVGVRDVVVDDNKEHPGDFALWKQDDKHLMQWFSPWGWGFPGWHIECSAMAMKYLGDTLDLHAGGEDLVFPHHESEIAQSESLTGKPFSRHWIHTRFLVVDGEKMSKSKGNFYTVRDLVDERGHDPIALRFALMATPYNKPLNFTMQSLSDAGKNVERFRECRRVAEGAVDRSGGVELSAELDRLYGEALDAMCDDLNTSVALAKALEGTGVIFREQSLLGGDSARAAVRYLDQINELLGICPPETQEEQSFEAELQVDIERRAELKLAKLFAEADAIRLKWLDQGVELRDTPDGTVWKLVKP